MDLTKDALEFLTELAAPTIHQDGEDREFSNRTLHPVNVDLPEPVKVSTLSGFCDLITGKIENFAADQVIAQVVGHDRVSLIARISDPWGRRQTFIESHLPELEPFRFGQFLDHENFLIGVMAHFTNTPDREYLIQMASHIGTEKVRTSLDDGISQEATLKQGSSLKTSVTVRNRLQLAPFRTFREIDQPLSEFLFRLRGGSESAPPTLALFEADGGKWKIDAMEGIGKYLRIVVNEATNIPVVI